MAKKKKIPGQKEMNEVLQRIKSGDTQSKKELIGEDLRIVVEVAKEFQGQGVPLEDLISAGNLGLIKAAERFDETKGFKFLPYAVYWIRAAIVQSLSDH